MSITGPDVSSFQGRVDWRRVKAAGHQFGFVKATEGDTYVNPTFAREWDAIKAAGMIRGAYHFGRPQSDARSQARRFAKAVGGYTRGELPPVLDIETSDGHNPKYVAAWVEAFIDEAHKQFGVQPMIYTGGPFWRSSVKSMHTYGCPLWLAAYVKDPQPYVPGAWKTYTFWQYTSSAKVPGVAGNCDLSSFHGDAAALAKLCGVPAAKTVDDKTRARWESNVTVLDRVLKAHPDWPAVTKKGLRWSRDRYRRALARR